jgi:hypothetical protein
MELRPRLNATRMQFDCCAQPLCPANRNRLSVAARSEQDLQIRSGGGGSLTLGGSLAGKPLRLEPLEIGPERIVSLLAFDEGRLRIPAALFLQSGTLLRGARTPLFLLVCHAYQRLRFPKVPRSPRTGPATSARRANRTSDLRNRSSPRIKNIPLFRIANQCHNPLRSGPIEGRIAIVTARWIRNAMDAVASGGLRLVGRNVLQRTAKSCGPGAATLASSRVVSPTPATVARKAAHRGEHEAAVKTIARGKPVRLAEPVVTMLVCFFQSANEAAGAVCARLSLRPLR